MVEQGNAESGELTDGVRRGKAAAGGPLHGAQGTERPAGAGGDL